MRLREPRGRTKGPPAEAWGGFTCGGIVRGLRSIGRGGDAERYSEVERILDQVDWVWGNGGDGREGETRGI